MTAISAFSQSYQSSFSDVKFDRAKGPATFSAGVEVDAASGAASVNLPFGPGIGERGLKFRPLLTMRMGPQLAVSSANENFILLPETQAAAVWGSQSVDTLYQRGFGSASFSPGTLDLGTMVSNFDRKKTNYSLPGGGGGKALGVLPTGMNQSVAQSLLAKFDFVGTDTVGFTPGAVSRTQKDPFLLMGSDGSLIVGLRQAGVVGGVTDEVTADIQQYPASGLYTWDFPRRVVVIQGEVAYEFSYVHHTYMTRTIPYLAISQKTQLYSGHYVITKIRNKFKERIDFTYENDGIGYTATWSTNPGVQIRVRVVGSVPVSPAQPRLMDNRYQAGTATQIRVSYQGISQPVASYLLEVSDPTLGGPLAVASGGPNTEPAKTGINGVIDWDWVGFGSSVQSIQPIRVAQEFTNEEIRFSYGIGPASSWQDIANTTISPTVLTDVTFPTRTVHLTWEPYRYRKNYNPEGWGGIIPSTMPGRPAFGYGVIGISDSDGLQTRQTQHARVVPTSNWNNLQNPPTDAWVDYMFYDAIVQPDGTISVHRFVSPPTSNGTAGSDGMQNLAFVKNIEREVRYYLPGTDWKSDLAVTNPASSSAYKWVVKDRFDVRTTGSPNGDLVNQSVPYPTRIRTWDKESQVLTTEETTDWDTANAAYGWKTTHTTTSITGSPSFPIEYLSAAQQGISYGGYSASQGIYRRVDKTFEPKTADWIFARVKTEQTTLVQDNTGFLASGLPDAQPLLTRTFNADINRVESVAVSNVNAPTVTTTFTFQGTSGLSATELLTAYLSSPGLVLSGQLGVSNYGYDANGYLNAIGQKPNGGTALTTRQQSDELGRPVTQTDLNGTVKSFSWDQAGRLLGISTSDNDVATTIAYNDTDHRGITVTHGAQISTYRYNGFGKLTVERRIGPDGTWSHRIHGYDLAGRKTGETVWQPGDGANHEAEWVKPNLTQNVTTTTTTADKTICKRYGLDGDGNTVCLTWQTIPGGTTTTTTNAAYAGAATAYDGRGRVISSQDANLVKTTTEYFGPGTLPPGVSTYVGPVRKITTGPSTSVVQVKWFESDGAGRLVRSITPVTRNKNTLTNLRTEYRYDGGGRIKEVKQFDEANRVQTRTWGYNGLGWLNALGQPESGITGYDGFTVAGKPTITNYNGRVVRMTPDWMGRPLSIWSDDASVSQAYAYDTALNGLGRLATSSDRSVTTAYSYGGQGKRLDSLTTTVPVQGVAQAFTQNFTYDAYGNRTSGYTSHNTWVQTYHPAAGLPNVLTMGGNPVASTPWNYYDTTSGALKRIDYGNGVKSTFDYDADQARLHQVTHSPSSGGPLAQWTYTYDEVGNLARENDVLTGAFDQYTYDELNRLISADVQSPTYGEQLQIFDYDAFGNRISSNIQQVTGWSGAKGSTQPYTVASLLLTDPNRLVVNATFTQGDANLMQNRLPAATSTGVPTGATYDAQGNLTGVFEKPTGVNPVAITMTYDALGRVLSAASTRTGITETYQYTVEGLRTVVQEYNGSTLQKTRVNLYNDGRQLISQYEKAAAGTLTWKRDIVYLGTREAAEFDSVGIHVTQVDHLGSPRLVTNSNQVVESRQKYLPFGELLEQSPTTFKSAKGFTNHEQTDSSGLIYMQARFYAPQYGRFASTDPARDQHFEDTQSWNIYSYVRNNPIMGTDPTGMEKEANQAQQTGVQGNGITQAMEGVGKDNNPQKQNEFESQTNQGSTGSSDSRNVLALVWEAKFPYFFLGGSVGHMALFDIPSGDTVVSQFPLDGGLPGSPNETKSLTDTIAAEGRPPNFVFFISVTNGSAMDAKAAQERGTEKWTMWRTENGTQCTVSGTSVLQSGGTPVGNHWLPGFAGRDLQGLSQNSSTTGVYQVNPNWFAGTLW